MSPRHVVYPYRLGLPRKFDKFRKGQLELALKVLGSDKRVSAISAPTGCLAGDTVIQIARGSGIRVSHKTTMETEYRLQHGSRRRVGLVSHTRSLIEGYLRAQPIHGVSYSGIRETHLLTLTDGTQLRATGDHRILTEAGWIHFLV